MNTSVTYRLSTKSIVDQVLAIVAFRNSFTNSDSSESNVVGIDRMPAVRLVVKSAFTKVVVRLADFVDDSSLDNETAIAAVNGDEFIENSDFALSVALFTPQSVGAKAQGIIRRHLEHAVACLALSIVYVGDSVDASRRYEELADSSVGRLINLLTLSRLDDIPKTFPLVWL